MAITTTRKADHIRINLHDDVAAKGVTTGFEHYRFIPAALPELNLQDVDLRVELFDKELSGPIFISCMTGGTPEAGRLNQSLAEAAQQLRIPLGVGSGRVLLERNETTSTFDVRPFAPDILLFANLGAVQLNRGVGVDGCQRLVDLLRADALVLHLNALQEGLQVEGDTEFEGLLAKIALVCDTLYVPVIVKEVGWGLAADTVSLLLDAGAAAVDVAGAGGTSWSEVERHRLHDRFRAEVAAEFAGWGIPTAEALVAARRTAPRACLFASGGVRSGMEIAKALALGADMVGMAGPFLRAAAQGPEALVTLASRYLEVLRLTMFATGARRVADLRRSPRLVRLPSESGLTTYTASLTVPTRASREFVDITDQIAAVLRQSGVQSGLVHIHANHTTAGIRINENEPGLLHDFRCLLDRLVPCGEYRHDDLRLRPGVPPDERMNGHAHCQQLLLATSETLPVLDGAMALGQWQRIFLVELDGARCRDVTVQVVGC